MRIVHHLIKSPFVAATGAAAFVHSTWTIAVIFGGQHPSVSDLGSFINWLAWAAPAMLIAFALDIGQINTSIEIAEGQRTWQKYLAFAVFALATYFLQWFHLVHHFPQIALSPGVQDTALISGLKSLAIWIAPGLLPASTLLYTFSHSSKHAPAPEVAAVTENPLSLPRIVEISKNGHAPASATANGASSRSRVNHVPPADSVQPGAE